MCTTENFINCILEVKVKLLQTYLFSSLGKTPGRKHMILWKSSSSSGNLVLEMLMPFEEHAIIGRASISAIIGRSKQQFAMIGR